MKVIAGRTYFYMPNMLDHYDPRTNLIEGEEVRVVNMHGCPRANTMGHCHIERMDGTFAGLVHTNSLHTLADYKNWLRARIAKCKAEMANKYKGCGCPVNSECIHDRHLIGTCEFCFAPNVSLVATLKADVDQNVCEVCHNDHRIPTVGKAVQ